MMRTFNKVSQYEWWAYKCFNTWYARTRVKGKLLLMHELIKGKAHLGFQWDHKNLDGLDNQKINLRLATPAQNKMNTPSRRGRVYKGVTHARGGGYRAYIRNKGKLLPLGKYKTIEEAAQAYDKKAKVLFGEFARLNF